MQKDILLLGAVDCKYSKDLWQGIKRNSDNNCSMKTIVNDFLVGWLLKGKIVSNSVMQNGTSGKDCHVPGLQGMCNTYLPMTLSLGIISLSIVLCAFRGRANVITDFVSHVNLAKHNFNTHPDN